MNVMSFKEIILGKQQEQDAVKMAVLTDFKESAAGMVKYTKEQLPLIDKALHDVDRWIAVNLGGIKPGNLPKAVSTLLGQLEPLRNNPQVVRQALAEFDKLTLAELWGSRVDGSRDINREAVLRSSFVARLGIARGTEGGVRQILKSLQAALADFEEWQTWTSENLPQAKEPGADQGDQGGIVVPEKKPAPQAIPTQSEFDPRI